jgi:hypothetical protein
MYRATTICEVFSSHGTDYKTAAFWNVMPFIDLLFYIHSTNPQKENMLDTE